MVKDGSWARHPSRDGVFRRVENEIIKMDYQAAPTTPLDVRMALGLDKIIRIYPKGIGVIAGQKDGGKTAFCLETIRLNMDKWEILYVSSELSASELRVRLEARDDIKLGDWKFTAIERSDNFADVVLPDGLTFFDWLGGECTEKAFLVGDTIQGIHSRLKNGFAFVCLQQDRGREFGRGAGYTRDLARFYLSLCDNTAKISTAKSFRGEHSPVGNILKYNLVGGWKFVPHGEWASPEAYQKGKEGVR